MEQSAQAYGGTLNHNPRLTDSPASEVLLRGPMNAIPVPRQFQGKSYSLCKVVAHLLYGRSHKRTVSPP